jgi:protein-tyrosine kinase
MGRVYNALVKADRLTDGQRPIGRPAIQGAEPVGAARQAQVDLSSTPHFDFDDGRTTPVDFGNGFSLGETFVTERTPERFTAPLAFEPFASSARVPEGGMRVDASRDSASSASLPIKPIFAEPREVINVKNLSLDPHWAALTGGDPLASERYRTLAVRVTRRTLKTLMVTSAEDGEGKSTVAANLAWVMARRDNRRVLLIEASLRGHMPNVASGRGWLEMTDVSSELAETIVRLDPNGLYVMSAGGSRRKADLNDSDVDDALASSQFEKAVAELAGYFDFIVIDAPTICGSVGAQQLAAVADGTVVVARAGRTHHSRVMTAVGLVPQERRLGIVLNESEVGEDLAHRGGGNASIIRRLFGRKK